MLPSSIDSEAQLDRLLSDPDPAVTASLADLHGDVVILGVAGKMGVSLARLAARTSEAAGVRRTIYGVSRFTNPEIRSALAAEGVHPLPCDLLDEAAVARLPDAPNVISMAGMKFGAVGNPATTWAMNSYLAAVVCRRYPHSRIVAFSTGNVYGLTEPARGGSREDDEPAPIGEYAMSCLGRERLFEHFSQAHGTPVILLRLNYACDLRYGVLVDLARKVWREEAIDLTMGYFNTIWQGDANSLALRSFALAAVPPCILNLTGPELLSVRAASQALAARMGKTVRFTGTEAATSLLSNAERCHARLGKPLVAAELLINWVADWVRRGGRYLDKPTHFEERAGRF